MSMLRGFALLAAMLATAGRAAALDLKSDGDRSDDTVAARERLGDYDPFISREAERVVDHDRPLFSPKGVRIGNFIVLPSVGNDLVFDSNVLATNVDRRSDWRAEITPAVKVISRLPRHAIDFSMGGKIVEYFERRDMSYANAHAKLGVSLHFDHAHTLSMSVLSSFDHEDRLDPFAPRTAREQVPVWRNRASIGLTRDAGRLYGTISATADHVDYQDVTSTTGVVLDQDSRDMTTYSTELKAGYRFSPGFELRTKLRGLRQVNRGNALFDADAWGADALVGLSFQTSPLLRWQVLAGYGFRDFDRPDIPSTATSLFEGEVQWLPTQSVTITAGARREILDSGGAEAAGVIETGFKARADIEVWHNVVLKIGGEVREDVYQGSTRRDLSFVGRAGIEYYLSQNWLLSLSYEHLERQSSQSINDLTRDLVAFGAKYRY